MGAYILRRLLLVMPTLFGVMLINFALTQFVPGGPIDQIQARLQGEGDAIQALGGTDDAGAESGANYNSRVQVSMLEPSAGTRMFISLQALMCLMILSRLSFSLVRSEAINSTG